MSSALVQFWLSAAALVGLKLGGLTTLSWVWVLFPFWCLPAAFIATNLVAGVVLIALYGVPR